MSFKLVRFGTYALGMTTLPILERTHEMGSGASRLLLIDTPDGQLDMLGNERARRAPFTLPFNCKIYDTSASGLQTQLDTLKALRGKRDKLWIELPNGEFRWIYARLDGIDGMNNPRYGLSLALALTFSIQPQHWNGAWHDNWEFDAGYYFDEGLYFENGLVFALASTTITATVPNGGNIAIENCIIRVKAQTTSITNLVIKRIVGGVTQEHLVYSGTLTPGFYLVIDCGAGSVKNHVTGDSAHFARGADHKYDGWLKLEPGNNPIEITHTGGGATSSIEFNFYDGWE